MKTEKVIWTPQVVKYMVHLINKQEYTSIEIAGFISEKRSEEHTSELQSH